MEDETPRGRRPFTVPNEAVEHARRARDEIRQTVAALLPSLPPEFTTHRLAARREMLLAIRSLIDNAIERVDKPRTKAVEYQAGGRASD